MKLNYQHPRLTLTTLTALLNLAIACGAAEVREEFHQTYPLEKEGRIQLENVNGNVHITGWDREEVKVDAVKHAKTQENLDQVKIEVTAKPDSLRIKTKYPDSQKNKNNSTSVEYTLTVPNQARLGKVSTVNGGVEIQNVSGDVEASSVNGTVAASGLAGAVGLSTVNGSVKARLIAVKKDVKLNSVNGSITLALPSNANAHVSADTLNGGISCDLPLESKKQFPVGHKLEGSLGEGGPAIKLSSVNGGIHIDRTKSEEAEDK